MLLKKQDMYVTTKGIKSAENTTGWHQLVMRFRELEWSDISLDLIVKTASHAQNNEQHKCD